MRDAPTETTDSTAMRPWPRFYQVTIISAGRLRGAAHTDRRITLKARSRLKNGSGRAGGHPALILAVEEVDLGFTDTARIVGALGPHPRYLCARGVARSSFMGSGPARNGRSHW